MFSHLTSKQDIKKTLKSCLFPEAQEMNTLLYMDTKLTLKYYIINSEQVVIYLGCMHKSISI